LRQRLANTGEEFGVEAVEGEQGDAQRAALRGESILEGGELDVVGEDDGDGGKQVARPRGADAFEGVRGFAVSGRGDQKRSRHVCSDLPKMLPFVARRHKLKCPNANVNIPTRICFDCSKPSTCRSQMNGQGQMTQALLGQT